MTKPEHLLRLVTSRGPIDVDGPADITATEWGALAGVCSLMATEQKAQTSPVKVTWGQRVLEFRDTDALAEFLVSASKKGERNLLEELEELEENVEDIELADGEPGGSGE